MASSEELKNTKVAIYPDLVIVFYKIQIDQLNMIVLFWYLVNKTCSV